MSINSEEKKVRYAIDYYILYTVFSDHILIFSDHITIDNCYYLPTLYKKEVKTKGIDALKI